MLKPKPYEHKPIISAFEVLSTEDKTMFIKKYIVIATSASHAKTGVEQLGRKETVGGAKELVDYELVIAK
jgi:hypothetical protein